MQSSAEQCRAVQWHTAPSYLHRAYAPILFVCYTSPPGIVLFSFLHFNETPAIVTSVVIGLGIIFCGGAVIHNVFVWQKVGGGIEVENIKWN